MQGYPKFKYNRLASATLMLQVYASGSDNSSPPSTPESIATGISTIDLNITLDLDSNTLTHTDLMANS